MITNARFVVLYVRDQQKSLEFFTQRLGFEKLTDAPYGEGSRWLEVRPPGAQTYLVISAIDPEAQSVIRDRMGPMNPVWFNCDDLDKTYTDLKAQGVEFSVEPQIAPWDPSGNTRWAQFSDLDGNLFGLSQQDA